MAGFFPICIGVFFTLYTMSLSTEFKILNNKISYIQRDNELIKEKLKSLNEKLNDRNF